jgi:uncharacterized protein (TIGR03437 family)
MKLRSYIVLANSLLACPATAQPHDLSVTADGSRAIFSVGGALHPRGMANVPIGTQAYFYTAGGLQLIDSHFVDPQYGLVSISIDAGGSLLALNGVRACPPGGPFTNPTCRQGYERYQTVIRLPGGDLTFPGITAFSGSGRFAAVYNPEDVNLKSVLVIDLASGSQFSTGDLAASSGSFLTSDGSVVVSKDGQLVLASKTAGRGFGAWDGLATSLSVDDDGNTIVYEAARRVHARTAAGSDWPLGPDGVDSFQPSISRDGRTAAFLAIANGKPQVFVAPLDGSSRQLTTEPEGFREAKICGDGSVILALTATGRLLRIPVTSPETQQLLGPAFTVWTDGTWTTPGSAVTLRGDVATGNLRITVQGIDAPVVSAGPAAALYQVPWEVKADRSIPLPMTVAFDNSPWEWTQSSVGSAFAPYIRQSDILHQDFGSVVDQRNPATPGEVLHLFGTGFGPVDQPVPTGAPSPSDPLARITASCHWVDSLHNDQPLDVLFAGLAPTLVGQYQIELRIPAVGSAPGFVLLTCRRAGDPAGNIGQIVGVPVRP